MPDVGVPRSAPARKLVAALVVVAIPLATLALVFAYHQARTAIEARTHRAPGTLIDLGTHTMHFVARGEGGPTVVFDAGLPGTHHTWTGVQDALAPHARTIAYDRAGYGWSTRGPRPRTASAMAGELRRLLDAAGIPGPYVLVGHSFGGVVMRAFAQLHPRDVATLVLVDATHEDYRGAFPESYGAQERRTATQLRLGALLAPLGLQRLFRIGLLPPDPDTAPIRFRSDGFATAHDEFASMEASLADVRGTSLGDLPVIVVQRGLPHPPIPGMTPDEMVVLDQAWWALQHDLLGLSTDATLAVAEDAGHFVHHDRPDLVIDIVLAEIRRIEADPSPR